MTLAVGILCEADRYANGVRPQEMTRVLEAEGHEVKVVSASKAIATVVDAPGRSPAVRLLAAVTRLATFVFDKIDALPVALRGMLGLPAVVVIMLARASLLARYFADHKFDAIISESPVDQLLFRRRRLARCQILDLPSPFGDELFYGHRLSGLGRRAVNRLEYSGYRRADHLAFHWPLYTRYVQSRSYSGDNVLDIRYGVSTKTKQARFSPTPRLVFLGLLAGPWINIPLLERLCTIYPHIDIYGGPEPVGPLAAHYRGYAESLDVLADYQAGLVTITDDSLRRSSFSSKHLEYISYGLPVLTPEWRQDELLRPSSVYYSERTFLQSVAQLCERDTWSALSSAATALAGELTWSKALSPLVETFEDLQ